ncbi:hypothetical protein E4L96_00485 [Massilia arenosa]|uniref:Uncharacterized protein n=1 Tax=Zemynaea arenosa TaxID=2561931 RepID=A0A4Y9SY32_9BURK|nr:hypothetical protein [Massilia arenosa]TFW30269.1 hypothetical protein E4L96_00485 [Massilia arenosa]
MASKAPTAKAKAWILFDRIVALAAPGGQHSNPWVLEAGVLRYEPDFATLSQLLGVPLFLKANTQSGVPALAMDVWLSYELRRAGFGRDQVWPRPVNPRILPAPVAALLDALPADLAKQVQKRMEAKTAIKGATSSAASILGKNYLKQVDVIMTDWATGPELLISTKRMDSSYGKNAPNRVEESYGDAKNLRLRHPLAALGFMFGLRSDILTKEVLTAEWLFDLLAKLGQEDDAYHATGLVLMEYGGEAAKDDSGEDESSGLPEPGPEPEDEDAAPVLLPVSEVDQAIAQLPKVTIRSDATPPELAPGRFMATMITKVLGATPVNMHKEARQRRASPQRATSSSQV